MTFLSMHRAVDSSWTRRMLSLVVTLGWCYGSITVIEWAVKAPLSPVQFYFSFVGYMVLTVLAGIAIHKGFE